jgi:hypothetical protein
LTILLSLAAAAGGAASTALLAAAAAQVVSELLLAALLPFKPILLLLAQVALKILMALIPSLFQPHLRLVEGVEILIMERDKLVALAAVPQVILAALALAHRGKGTMVALAVVSVPPAAVAQVL